MSQFFERIKFYAGVKFFEGTVSIIEDTDGRFGKSYDINLVDGSDMIDE